MVPEWVPGKVPQTAKFDRSRRQAGGGGPFFGWGGRVGLEGRRPDPGLLVPDASRQEAEANFLLQSEASLTWPCMPIESPTCTESRHVQTLSPFDISQLQCNSANYLHSFGLPRGGLWDWSRGLHFDACQVFQLAGLTCALAWASGRELQVCCGCLRSGSTAPYLYKCTNSSPIDQQTSRMHLWEHRRLEGNSRQEACVCRNSGRSLAG